LKEFAPFIDGHNSFLRPFLSCVHSFLRSSMDTILSCGRLLFLKNICPPTHFSFFSDLFRQIDESRIYHVSVIFFDIHTL